MGRACLAADSMRSEQGGTGVDRGPQQAQQRECEISEPGSRDLASRSGCSPQGSVSRVSCRVESCSSPSSWMKSALISDVASTWAAMIECHTLIFSHSYKLGGSDQGARMAGVWRGFSPWLAAATFSLCPHVAFSLCVCRAPGPSSLPIRTVVLLDQGLTCTEYFTLITFFKSVCLYCLQVQSPCIVFTICILGDTVGSVTTGAPSL